MHFPTKKKEVIFGVAKKDATGGGGGGAEGVAFFGRNFSRLSFLNTSLIYFWGAFAFTKTFCFRRKSRRVTEP